MDFSKAHGCLPNDLKIAKLEAYEAYSSLKSLSHYLTSRKQRIKTDSSYSLWHDI